MHTRRLILVFDKCLLKVATTAEIKITSNGWEDVIDSIANQKIVT